MDESKKVPYAIGWAVIVIAVFSIPTGPPLVNMVAGFFPLIFTLLAGIGLFRSNKPIPQQSAIGIPVILALVLGLLGATGDATIFGQLSVWYLGLANIIGGLGVMAIFTDFFIATPIQSTPSHVHHHIEDALRYVYAINESIRRVYSNTNGGTAQLRKKVFLSTKHADNLDKQFNKKNYEEAHHIVYQLYEELRNLFEKESLAIGRHKFKNLHRDGHGQSRVIDVLINNDLEPVRDYVDNLALTLQHLNDELLNVRD